MPVGYDTGLAMRGADTAHGSAACRPASPYTVSVIQRLKPSLSMNYYSLGWLIPSSVLVTASAGQTAASRASRTFEDPDVEVLGTRRFRAATDSSGAPSFCSLRETQGLPRSLLKFSGEAQADHC